MIIENIDTECVSRYGWIRMFLEKKINSPFLSKVLITNSDDIEWIPCPTLKTLNKYAKTYGLTYDPIFNAYIHNDIKIGVDNTMEIFGNNEEYVCLYILTKPNIAAMANTSIKDIVLYNYYTEYMKDTAGYDMKNNYLKISDTKIIITEEIAKETIRKIICGTFF